MGDKYHQRNLLFFEKLKQEKLKEQHEKNIKTTQDIKSDELVKSINSEDNEDIVL